MPYLILDKSGFSFGRSDSGSSSTVPAVLGSGITSPFGGGKLPAFSSSGAMKPFGTSTDSGTSKPFSFSTAVQQAATTAASSTQGGITYFTLASCRSVVLIFFVEGDESKMLKTYLDNII